MRDFSQKYITIQGWMRTDLNLVGTELLIYALINGFCQDDSSCFNGSLSYLRDWTGTSKPTVIKALKSLCEKRLIERTEKPKNGVLFVEYRTLLGVKNLYGGSKETLQGGSKESLPNKDIKEKDSNKDNYSPLTPLNDESVKGEENVGTKNTPSKKDKEEDFQSVLDAYHLHCPKMPKVIKLTEKRKSAIRARIRDFGEEKIVEIFKRAGEINWMNGAGDRHWFASFDWLLTPDHATKVLEGGYRSQTQTKPQSNTQWGASHELSQEERIKDNYGYFD